VTDLCNIGTVYRQAAARCKEGMSVEVQYIRRSVELFYSILTATVDMNLDKTAPLSFFLVLPEKMLH